MEPYIYKTKLKERIMGGKVANQIDPAFLWASSFRRLEIEHPQQLVLRF